MTDGKFYVLFVCTGNTCRSPMAEALFQGGQNTVVQSRGLAAIPGQPATEYAAAAVKEYGCDLSKHRAAPLTKHDLETADLFVCMTEAHAAALVSAGVSPDKISVMHIPDPYGGTMEDYRKCAAKIKAELVKIYERIGA